MSEKKGTIKSKSRLPAVADQDKVNALLDKGMDEKRVESLAYRSHALDAGARSGGADLLSQIRKEFHVERVEAVIGELRSGVIASIAGPFGLGKALSVYDKAGGKVTTVHNANNGVYANEGDRYLRSDYDRARNSEGKQFAGTGKNSVGAEFTRSRMDRNQEVTDAYTGRWRKAHTTSPDHIESLSRFHKDGGFMLASERKADFATDTDNLALTDRSINASMKDFEKNEWKDKDRGDGVSNSEFYDVDEKRLQSELEKAGKARAEHLPGNREKAGYYIGESARTGVSEGAKMGLQQALGILMVEFFSSSLLEIRSAFRNGLEGKGLIDDLKIRLGRVASGLAEKKKDLLKEFSGGFLSGFLSNLVTTVVNLFVTTGKRVVRMIREGVLSLIKAIKVLLFPPENMTFSEVMHEAAKLVFSGGVVVGGVLLEEAVEKMLAGFPVLAPIAPAVTAAMVGSLTAVAAALIVYLVDRMDLFNAVKVQEQGFVADRLNKKLNHSIEECESLSIEVKDYL